MNAITMPSRGAYKVIDHTYDVVVVGAGGSGLRADARHGRRGAENSLHHESVPDP